MNDHPMHKQTARAIEARPGGVGLAIEAAGGVIRLARALGITDAAVSQWSRIPSDRIIEIEKLTGVRREILRPDLYPQDEPEPAPSPHNANGATNV